MAPPLHIADIIRHKRDNHPLSGAEIHHFIGAVVDRTATDAQISALLMAIFLRGLNPQELAALTTAMHFSGETFDSTSLNAFSIDKHSTGGVGDKTSLLIAPILAAAGRSTGLPKICVPMISGRSLGHTGGTLDKLETIPGFKTQLSLEAFRYVLQTCGAAMIGQTPALVPADRILYALRDHIGTIESPDLICASIMSKKLAEGLNALVLDVKTGSGAFLRSNEDARHLARLMVATGEAAGTRTIALLTSMDQPLGRFAGNWLEVQECVSIMQQHRHSLSSDLIDLTNTLAGWMLHLGGHVASPAEGATLSDTLLRSGAAYQAFLKIVAAQGGDICVFNPETASSNRNCHLDSARAGEKGPASRLFTRTLTAHTTGYLSSMDCTEVGWAVQRLGAGRLHPGEHVSAHAGIEMHAKLGDHLIHNQSVITLYAESAQLLDEPYAMLRTALEIAPTPPTLQPLVHEVITT